MSTKQLIKEAYVSPLVAWGLGNIIGYPSVLGATALGYGAAEAASTLNAAERAGLPKDYGDALERGISGGVGGTIGSLLGMAAGLASIPLLRGKGVPLGVTLLAPAIAGKIGGISGMKALSGPNNSQRVIPVNSRFDMTPVRRRLAYVKGKGVVKVSATKDKSLWSKAAPYMVGAGAAGVGLAGGYGATRLLARALKKKVLTKTELAAMLGVAIPSSLAAGHKAGTWTRKQLDSRRK